MPIWFGVPSPPPCSPNNDNRDLTPAGTIASRGFLLFSQLSNQVANHSDHSIPFSAAMYSGPVPQQPPTMLTPARMASTMAAANSAGERL